MFRKCGASNELVYLGEILKVYLPVLPQRLVELNCRHQIPYADDVRQNHGVRDQMFSLEWKVEAPQHGDSEGENLMRLTWLHVPLLRIRLCLQIEAALGRERENNSAFDVQQRTGHTEGCDAPARNTPADIAHEARGVWTSR